MLPEKLLGIIFFGAGAFAVVGQDLVGVVDDRQHTPLHRAADDVERKPQRVDGVVVLDRQEQALRDLLEVRIDVGYTFRSNGFRKPIE